eukprot:3354609-Pyramimonas_sp.AAC.2
MPPIQSYVYVYPMHRGPRCPLPQHTHSIHKQQCFLKLYIICFKDISSPNMNRTLSWWAALTTTKRRVSAHTTARTTAL